MSALELALRNLAAWSAQVGVLGLAAAVLARLVPVERPAARLALGQALLATVLVLPFLQPWHATAPTVTWSSSPPSAAANSPATPPVAPGRAPLWPLAVAGLLVAGVTLGLTRIGLGLHRLRSLRRRARPLDAPPWLLALGDELSARARFLLSDETATPATFGMRRPVVLLPPAFLSMDRGHQRAVVLHELWHARRGHWAALILEEILKAVLFFHPAVHWLVGRVRLAREQTVDAAVVRRLGERGDYLASLVAVGRLAVHDRAVPAAPFLGESHLRERVDLLLKEVSMSRLRTLGHVALTAVLLVLAVAWTASAVPLQSKPAAAPSAVEDKATAPGEPRLVSQVRPVYPPQAKDEKVEGLFEMEVVIGRDGAVADARIVASAPTEARLKGLEAQKGSPSAQEGDARLAAAALDAVKQWRFEPILEDGKPVEARAFATVVFKIY